MQRNVLNNNKGVSLYQVMAAGIIATLFFLTSYAIITQMFLTINRNYNKFEAENEAKRLVSFFQKTDALSAISDGDYEWIDSDKPIFNQCRDLFPHDSSSNEICTYALEPLETSKKEFRKEVFIYPYDSTDSIDQLKHLSNVHSMYSLQNYLNSYNESTIPIESENPILRISVVVFYTDSSSVVANGLIEL